MNVREQHIEAFKRDMSEQGINPESHFGKELVKQTNLLFNLEERVRKMEKKPLVATINTNVEKGGDALEIKANTTSRMSVDVQISKPE